MTEQIRPNGTLRHLLTLEGLPRQQIEALLRPRGHDDVFGTAIDATRGHELRQRPSQQRCTGRVAILQARDRIAAIGRIERLRDAFAIEQILRRVAARE